METTPNAVGKFLDPEAIIAQLDVEHGCIAADFGCGPGYFSLPFAKTVGVGGKVFSLDVLPQALETVVGKAKNSGVANITAMRVNLEKENGSKLESESVDWIILKDILFQNQKKDVIIGEAYRILKPGGKVIVVEWNQSVCNRIRQGEESLSIGPDCEIMIPQDTLEKMFQDRKFHIEKNIDAGDFHYAFVAIK